MTAVELKSYSDLKEELVQYRIPIDDISKFAKAVWGLSQKGYDVSKVIEEFSELELARSNYWDYQARMPDLKIKYDGLNQEYSKLEQSVNSCKQKLSLNDELQAMGFGIKELKLLRNTIKEIADANNIPPNQAQQKFYKDIEEQYDDKLGFESKLNKLRSEITTVSNNLTLLRTSTLAQPLVGPSLQRLFSKGLSEQDIVELANMLERSHSDSSNNDIDDDKNKSSSSSTGINKHSLITELQKYDGIKPTAIQELNQQVDKLKNQIDELQTRKKDLEDQNQSMLSILAYSKPVVQFFNRTDDDHSFGNDYNNVNILAAIAIILHILYIRYEGVGKLVTGEHTELMPLSRAVASGGNVQAISIPQLKTTIAKALEILIAKLVDDTKPETKEDLVVQGSTSSINNNNNNNNQQQHNSKNV
jgi:predicted  nucleic acid-binding Zn-ribbon protein